MWRKYVLILVGVMFVCLVAACDSDAVMTASLPDEAKHALDNHLEHVYTIVSAVRGTNPTEASISAEEVWCVVIDPPMPANPFGTNVPNAHFYLYRIGLLWTLRYNLNEDGYLRLGCDNWND
jgi:hypothetical protein